MAKRNIAAKKSEAGRSGNRGKAWKWGIGAAGVAAVGAAAFNVINARRADEANPPLGQFIEVDGVKLHYIEQGEGPLIVLLHGNGTMVQDWIASGLFDDLAETYRVIAFDRPGFGHSERPRNVVWTPAAQARLIAKALGALGAEKATIVGHSFGTLVAVCLGLDHPTVARSLVLIGGYYFASIRADSVLISPPAIPLVGDAIRYTVSPILGAAMKRGLEKQLFGPASVSDGWNNAYPFEMSLRPSQIRASAAEAAIMVPAAAKTQSRLFQLQLPVSIIAGKGDKVVSCSGQSERLAGILPHADLLVIENAGHMVHHSEKRRVAAAIEAVTEDAELAW